MHMHHGHVLRPAGGLIKEKQKNFSHHVRIAMKWLSLDLFSKT